MALDRTDPPRTEFDRWLEFRHQQLLAGDDTAAADQDASRPDSPVAHSAELCLRVLEQLRRGNATSAAGGSGDALGVAATRAHPRQIGRFRIESTIGQGAAGLVLLAFDPKLGRRVALKVPHVDALATETLCQRFVREAEAAARLQHPNVVAVYEVGREGPLAYIASEYCCGGTLHDWIHRPGERTGLREVAELFAAIADGLEHAHQRGVLHRDVKPSNVVLEPPPNGAAEGGLPTPKLTDFGLAKVTEDDGDLTRTGMVIGTANYMAPEQASGAVREIGVGSDIFGLGCMLYEALVGTPPFAGKNRADTLRRLLTEEPDRPSRMRRNIPPDLEAICLSCLEKQPERRYSSARLLAEDLRRFLSGQTTIARPLGQVARSWRWCRRNPMSSTLLGTLIAGVLAVLFGTLVFNHNLQRALESAVAAQQQAKDRADALRRRTYSDDMQHLFASLQSGNVQGIRNQLYEYLPQPGQEDLRTFPWHFMWRRTFGDHRVLYRHDGAVYRVRYSPDGSMIASCSADGTVKLWDRQQGQVVRTLVGHTDEVNGVIFSSDGDYLATAGNDGSVRVWAIQDPNTPPRVLTGMAQNWVYTVGFSPDGRRLAAGGEDGILWIWETENFELEQQITQSSTIERLAFTSDGEHVILGCENGQLRSIPLNEPEASSILFRAPNSLNAFDFLHNSPKIACGWAESEIAICAQDRSKVFQRRKLEFHPGISGVAVSPDDRWLAVAGREGHVRLTHLTQEQREQYLLGHTGDVWGVAFSPDGQHLLTCGSDGTVREWDFEGIQAREQRSTLLAKECLNDSRLSPDGDYLAGWSQTGKLYFWDVRDLSLRWSLDAVGQPSSECALLRFSKDGNHLAVACGGNEPDGAPGETRTAIHIVNCETGAARFLTQVDRFITALAFSPDGKSVAVGKRGGEVLVVEIETGAMVPSFRIIADGTVGDIAYSADGRSLFTHHGGRIHVWNTTTWQRESDLAIPGVATELLAVSPDGKLLASAGTRHNVIWNLKTGEHKMLTGNFKHVEQVSFSPDNQTLVTLAHDLRLRFWDVRTGRIVMTWESPGLRMVYPGFLPDGSLLLISLADGGKDWQGTVAERFLTSPPRWSAPDRAIGSYPTAE